MSNFLYFIGSIIYRVTIGFFNIIIWKTLYGLKWKNSTLYDIAKNKDLFILGTGESVNAYNEKVWHEIRNGYSMGLNMWVIHDFVPNIYLLELLSENERYLDNLLQIFKERQDELTDTKIYIKSNYLFPWKYKRIHNFFKRLPSTVKKNLYLVSDFPITGHTLVKYKRSIDWLNKSHFFDVRTKRYRLCAQARASLGFAVIFGIQNGFRKIVLCGVDLNNDNHFYDGSTYYFDKYKINHTRNNVKIVRHLTNDPNVIEVTISKALFVLDSLVCQPRGIVIEIGSKKSALYPKYPLAFMDSNEKI